MNLLRRLILVGMMCVGLSAAAQNEEKNSSEQDEFDCLAKIFKPAGTPKVKEWIWVTVDLGPVNFPLDIEGWLIKDTPQALEFLDEYGHYHELRKPTNDEKRPRLKADKEGFVSGHLYENADRSTAWKVQAGNFKEKCQKFIDDGMPAPDQSDFFKISSRRFRHSQYVVDAARHGYFAREVGDNKLATALMAEARKSLLEYYDSYSSDRLPLHEFVADRISMGLCDDAIFSGHDNVPRKTLLQKWERIAAMPYHKRNDQAKVMIKHYQSLIEEDRRWVEPDQKAFAKYTAEQKVEYWLYHLRDLDVAQYMDPGRCRVLDDFGRDLDENNKKPNAAIELKNIGMAAVPQLIAHLDDARPTRCKGHWRSYSPEGQYLLRYGDCCQQILEAITGQSLFRGTTTVSYPIHDGQGKVGKEKAEKWWAEYKQPNPDALKRD